MTTISVPINSEQEAFIKSLVESGSAASTAHAVRKAIDLLSEQEVVRRVLEAEREPTLRGDLRDLVEKFS